MTTVPLVPTPTALIPIGTLDSPGAGVDGVVAVVVPVVVVVAAGVVARCAKPKVLASAKPAAIKIVREAILGSLRTA